jgi:hypothetical protein
MTQPKISEHTHQVQVILWANLMAKRKYPMLRWIYAVPNGGNRHIVTARKLKAEGVKSGVPDLCLPYPKRGRVPMDASGEDCFDTIYGDPFYFCCGLYIEMKTRTPMGKISKDQEEWIDYLKGVGYKVVACWSADEAIQAIEDYLNGN